MFFTGTDRFAAQRAPSRSRVSPLKRYFENRARGFRLIIFFPSTEIFRVLRLNNFIVRKMTKKISRVILTNVDRRNLRTRFRNVFGYSKYAVSAVISHEIRAPKTDPQIYHFVNTRALVSSVNIVHGTCARDFRRVNGIVGNCSVCVCVCMCTMTVVFTFRDRSKCDIRSLFFDF